MQFFPSNKDKLKVVTLCLLAATTFWFFSALNKTDYTTRIEYPLTFNYDQDSTYVLSSLPENILIEVSGGGWNLLRKTLLFDTPPIEVPLEDPVSTKYITGQSLSQQLAEQLGDVRLDYVVTDTLFINIDEAAEKEVMLTLDSSSIHLGDSYQLVSPVVLSTRRAILKGPSTILQDIGDTLYISLPNSESEVRADYKQIVSLEYSTSDLVRVTPEEIEVEFRVAPFDLLTRSVAVTTIDFPADSSLRLSPNRVDVTFWIQNEYLDLIKEFDFEVVANLRTLNTKDSTLTPVLRTYPEFAKNIAISPSKLRVEHVQ
ncbi:hypothetical protein OKW21_006292 [Catalinimonas alkaloidigena]|uniref:hypothetical protein n=1 Tax=Catalinimonas alkaloidigena TaxID=1075417 RepID=UPI0024066B30|nr:hypothetical protein [Catalinimonas alkaloidigena]MDF9801029.1 hypothetical protein [Catalinimonas alkaloidigena]